MNPPWAGHGLGKLILAGEHAVVYGWPALAVAIDRGTTVRLAPRPGPTAPTDDTIADDRLVPALRSLLPVHGLGVEIRTDLPIGRGMGSSAALAVALVRAEAARTEKAASADEVFERAFAIERIFHGNPSGLDHAVSARGGLIRYQRTPEGPRFTSLTVPSWSIVVLDSGEAGPTGTMVAGVAARRPAIDPVLAAIGELVDRAIEVIDDPASLGRLLTQNHRLLSAIGVSTPRLDDLVELALHAGAHGAKLAGAGGGGVVLALAEHPDRIAQAATRRGVTAFVCQPAPGEAP